MDINVLLFDDFETLDVFGPVEIFGHGPEYTLRYVSAEGGVVKSRHGAEIMTEPIVNADFSAILLIPGGFGTRPLVDDFAYIEELTEIAAQSAFCLTVCTGSGLLAKTGLLDGRRATSNKRAFAWAKSVNPAVDWVEHARWVRDGKFYTSSGVSAGMDMALGFIADRLGIEQAGEIASAIEYIWNTDKDNDPFAIA